MDSARAIVSSSGMRWIHVGLLAVLADTAVHFPHHAGRRELAMPIAFAKSGKIEIHRMT